MLTRTALDGILRHYPAQAFIISTARGWISLKRQMLRNGKHFASLVAERAALHKHIDSSESGRTAARLGKTVDHERSQLASAHERDFGALMAQRRLLKMHEGEAAHAADRISRQKNLLWAAQRKLAAVQRIIDSHDGHDGHGHAEDIRAAVRAAVGADRPASEDDVLVSIGGGRS